MKFDLKGLLLAFVLFAILITARDEVMNPNKIKDSINNLGFINSMILLITTKASFFIYSFIAYTALFKFYNSKKIFQYVGLILLSVPFAIAFRYFVQEIVLREILGFGNYFNPQNINFYFIDNLYYAIVYPLFGIGYFFFQHSQHSAAQKKQLEIENKQTQLSALQAQLNPHLLFNTLNNIYSQVQLNSPHALPSIDKLSKLLRYALYEKESFVAIEQELSYINDFIALQKLRHDYSLCYTFNPTGHLNGIAIPPFTLFPFIENSFKHGVLNDPDNPIRIQLNRSNDKLMLEVRNKINNYQKDEVGGIGLKNAKKRLDLIYDKHYHLKITSTHQLYHVNLIVPIL